MLCYEPGSRGFESHDAIAFIFYLPIASCRTRPGVYLASDRNEYKKHKSGVSGGVEQGLYIRLATLPPSVGRLSRQCGILNISQPYRLALPVTGIATFFFCPLVSISLAPTATATVFSQGHRRCLLCPGAMTFNQVS
jgi:hypothetical protein